MASRTRRSSHDAMEPGNRTTSSARTSAAISSTDGTVTSPSSPARPSWIASDEEGDRP
jgi:hypothetical protein